MYCLTCWNGTTLFYDKELIRTGAGLIAEAASVRSEWRIVQPPVGISTTLDSAPARALFFACTNHPGQGVSVVQMRQPPTSLTTRFSATPLLS